MANNTDVNASFLRPRRGKNATAIQKLGVSSPLKNGEVFFECESYGTQRGNIMMGNGTTAYANLNYFLVNEDKAMSFTNCSEINSSTAESDVSLLNKISSINQPGTFKNAMNSIKQLLWNHSSRLNSIESRLNALEHH